MHTNRRIHSLERVREETNPKEDSVISIWYFRPHQPRFLPFLQQPSLRPSI